MVKEPIITIHPDAPKDEEFLKKVEELRHRLTNADELHALALHEAGHEYYYRVMGITRFDYSGPIAGPGKDDFFGASIMPTYATNAFINLEPLKRIYLVARASTAGGSVTKFIVKRSDRGNRADLDGFIKANLVILSEHKLTLNLKDVWDKAERETDREVRRFAIKNEIKRIAWNIKPLLFKWLE